VSRRRRASDRPGCRPGRAHAGAHRGGRGHRPGGGQVSRLADALGLALGTVLAVAAALLGMWLLGVLPWPGGALRRRRLEVVVPAAILANSVVLGWGWFDHAHDVVAERIDTCFLVFFAAELAVRLRGGGWRWLRSPWNVLDAAIIAVALLPVIGDSITVLRIGRLARLVHLGRHTGHLRALPWLRQIARLDAARLGGRPGVRRRRSAPYGLATARGH
jgi:hypothetical protein